jgi:phage terminase large subunit
MPFHRRQERFAAMVAHRRAGKTVAAVNETLGRALRDGQGIKQRYGVDAKYALLAPFRGQIKDIAWSYLKHYSANVRTAPPNEAELRVKVVGGASITLYGADNPDAMRGIGLDGAYLDEFADMRPGTWSKVIRPALSDRNGWAVVAGTPKGHNEFYKILQNAQKDPDWYSCVLRASETGILSAAELAAVRRDLTEDEYAQEYECSFEAAILGAYYGVEMRELTDAGRITNVPYDPAIPVFTAWDLGLKDDTAIWDFQIARGEVHILDYYAVSGASIAEIAQVIRSRPYPYAKHYLPHDARAKTLASGGKSVVEQLATELGGMSQFAIVPNIGVQDGIQAVRRMLPRVWFNADTCNDGIEALRQYQREWDDEKKSFRASPRHDWTSHPADAFRMLAVVEREAAPEQPKESKPLLKYTLDELWEYTEAKHRAEGRI